MRYGPAILMVAAIGCDRGARPATEGTLSIAAGPPIALRHATAAITTDDQLVVHMADAPLPSSGPVASGSSLSFRVNSGPGHRFFAGPSVPVSFSVTSRPLEIDGAATGAHRGSVQIQPFEPRMGSRVRGAYVLDATAPASGGRHVIARGTFDAPLTGVYDAGALRAPERAAAGHVRGVVDGSPFEVGSAVATVAADADGIRRFDAIWLFAAADVSCDGVHAAAGSPHLRLEGPGQSSQPSGIAPLSGIAMPVDPQWTSGIGGAIATFGYGPPAWLRLDGNVSLQEGASLRGELFAESRPNTATRFVPARLEGHFEARVCDRRPLPWAPPPPH